MMKSNYSNERRKETLLMMISSNDDVCFRCCFYVFMMFVFVLRRRPSFPSFLRFEVVVIGCRSPCSLAVFFRSITSDDRP